MRNSQQQDFTMYKSILRFVFLRCVKIPYDNFVKQLSALYNLTFFSQFG